MAQRATLTTTMHACGSVGHHPSCWRRRRRGDRCHRMLIGACNPAVCGAILCNSVQSCAIPHPVCPSPSIYPICPPRPICPPAPAVHPTPSAHLSRPAAPSLLCTPSQTPTSMARTPGRSRHSGWRPRTCPPTSAAGLCKSNGSHISLGHFTRISHGFLGSCSVVWCAPGVPEYSACALGADFSMLTMMIWAGHFHLTGWVHGVQAVGGVHQRPE